MRIGFVAAAFTALIAAQAFAAEAAPSVEQSLAKLKDADPENRIEALRDLMTSVDPRLPELMLGLLSDEGNSIRRLAARGIGSRWWQIPKERAPEFVAKLKQNASNKEFEDEANMAKRAIALLRRTYDNDMVVRSPNGRWVVYERRGLPCLIDTSTDTEELLGWSEGDYASLMGAWGNESIKPSVFWHPKQEAVAVEVLLTRHASTVWVWRHQLGLRKLTTEDLLKAIRVREAQLVCGDCVNVDIKGWQNDDVHFEVSYTLRKGDDGVDYVTTMTWNAAKGPPRVLSTKKVQ